MPPSSRSVPPEFRHRATRVSASRTCVAAACHPRCGSVPPACGSVHPNSGSGSHAFRRSMFRSYRCMPSALGRFNILFKVTCVREQAPGGISNAFSFNGLLKRPKEITPITKTLTNTSTTRLKPLLGPDSGSSAGQRSSAKASGVQRTQIKKTNIENLVG